MTNLGLQYFFIKNNLWNFFKACCKMSVSYIGYILTFKQAVLEFMSNPTLESIVRLVIGCLFFAAILFAIWWNLPKIRASYKNNDSGVEVIVEHCNLFKQKGIKIIHTVDTFETNVCELYGGSVHQQFLNLQKDMPGIVQESLSKNSDKTIVCVDDDLINERLHCSSRYKLGTVLSLDSTDTSIADEYKLVAYAPIKKNEINGKYTTEDLTVENYKNMLENMWRNLRASIKDKSSTVNMAIIGNKFSNYPEEFNSEHKIAMIIDTFYKVCRSENKRFCKTLRICVHEENAKEIDFSNLPVIIKHYATKPIL